ncbi:ABC transporter permease [Arthrobacter sp. NPDC058130]|uniref:ABC transporter permease n=1 Tax=Arthrobacter sp. NPDC058130 TaxID=3346353 RepID=UPI0036DFC3AE
MLHFIVKRVLMGVALLLGVSTVTYALIYSGGSNIADQVLGGEASPEAVAAKAAELGLDQPLWQQYLGWLAGAVHGDLGTSWYTSQDVLTTILQRLSVTLSIVVLSIVLVTIFSVCVGVLAAVKRGWIDSALQFVSVIGLALPSFWVALVLVLVFAISLHVLPATGFVPFAKSPSAWFSSVILPVTALSIGASSATAQQVRSAVISVLEQDYIRTLRARGLSGRRVLWGHVLRNAAPPALTVLSLQFISLVGGAVIIERVYAINGMGSLAVDSTLKNDIPVVVGVMVTMTVVVVIVNLAIDILNGFINPKARIES